MLKFLQIFLVTIFFAMPLLGLITVPSDYIVKGENRRVFQLPELGSKTYFNDLQNFIKDRIFLKIWSNENLFNFYNSNFKEVNFTSSSLTDNLDFMVEGLHGWLYAGNVHNYVYSQHSEDLLNSFNEERVNDKLDLLKAIENLSKSNNSSFLFVVGPDKHGIYPEYMSYFLSPGKYRFFSELKKYFDKSNIPYLDLFDIEVKNKDPEKKKTLYFSDDTHWNLYGAFLGFKEVLKVLEGNEYKPYEYSFTFVPHNGGDLVRNIKQPENEFLDHAIASRNNAPLIKKIYLEDNSEMYSKLDYVPDLKFNIKYLNDNAPLNKTVLMISDSFGYFMCPFMADNYRNVVFVNRLETTLDDVQKLINDNNPDHIIYINVERNVIDLMSDK